MPSESIKTSNFTCMVLGGAGFIGSAVVRKMLSSGFQVISYDNYLHGNPGNLSGLKGPLTIIRGDVLDSWKLSRIIRERSVRWLIHCAGDTFVPSAYEVPQRFFDVNLQGTLNVLMAAKDYTIERMVYVSSTEVYGPHPGKKLSEDTCLNPVNTYAVSKLAADRLCFTFAVEHKVPVVIARIFNCYGPRETHPYIVPEIMSQLNRGSVLRLGNMKANRDLTYVDDMAMALISLLDCDLPNGEVVNIGSGTCYSVEWLAHTIAELMDVKNLRIEEDERRFRRYDINSFSCNYSKLFQYTAWKPSVTIEEGLHRTLTWFRENGFRWSWEYNSQDFW